MIRTFAIGAAIAAVFASFSSIAGAFAPAVSSYLNTSGVLRAPGVGEDRPFLLAPGFDQRVLADQLNTFSPAYTPGAVGGGARWGNWDMSVMNTTGVDAGRYLFTPHEINGQGVSRYDFQTKTMVNLALNNTVLNSRLDPSRWTPWGSIIAADESQGGSIFEITNPLKDMSDGVAATSVQRLAVGRVAFEGIDRRPDGNWYYGDEGTSGIFRYVPDSTVRGTANELTKGQIFGLKLDSPTVLEGNNTGAGTWIPLNNADGTTIAGIPDPTIDTRIAGVAAGVTTWARPEDGHVRQLANGDYAFITTITGTNSVITVNLNDSTPSVVNFATRSTIDLATGVAAGTTFSNADNIEFDSNGRAYILEDGEPNGGDIWTTVDADNNGVAESMGRWASLLTAGSEPTGLYFDPFRNQAYVNVQHPTSGNGMTVVLLVPEPTSVAALGMSALTLLRRSRRK